MLNNNLEKKALVSKKFLAFFFVESIMVIMAMTALITGSTGWPISAFMLSIILTMGALAIGYILGQAALDKYVRIAQVTNRDPLGGGEDGQKPDLE